MRPKPHFSVLFPSLPLVLSLAMLGCQPVVSKNGSKIVGQLDTFPDSVDFGDVAVGSSQSQRVVLSASIAPVTISSVAIQGRAFAINGLSFPLDLSAGQSKEFTITFAPSAVGTATGALTILSNASNYRAVEAITGTGTGASGHSVSLSWARSAATSSAVIGYNVYRAATSTGPFTKINPGLARNTSYTDTNVLPGQTYWYVTTAVSSFGMESSYSNAIEIIIPTP